LSVTRCKTAPKINYQRLLPVEPPADQVSGIVDFQDERVREVTTQAATVLDVPSLIDTGALLEFDSSTGRISGGLADLDDQSLVARLRLKSG
jgi:hypothetical protein